MFFAAGSAIFCWLLWSGRLIPARLAALGAIWSSLLVGQLTLQAAGMFGGKTNWNSPVTWAIWLPLLVFELAFAGWLLVKGVNVVPAERQPANQLR